MAVLELDQVWINLWATGDALAAQAVRGRKSSYNIDGEVRSYVGGRQRAVSTVGERGTLTTALCAVTVPELDTLRAWKGQTVQYRDPRGQRFVGVFFQLDVDEVKPRDDLYLVALVIRTVTVPPGA